MSPTAAVRERVVTIIRQVFDAPDLDVHDRLSPQEVPQWDSLNHINLVVALENEFGIQFQGEEIAAINHIGTLFSFLERYGVA